jgi:DNA-binding transcriptional LysR family regulator
MDRLKSIETFVRVARALSVSDAARSLGISRGLASVHLKQLEDHLGVRLINRTTRQLSMTEAGKDYLEFCVRVLESFEEKDAEISLGQKVPRGHLKILASAALAEFVISPIVAGFAAAYPDMQISLITATRSNFSSELVEFGYDLGITMHPVEEATMVVSRLGCVPWRPYASVDYLEKRGTPLHPEDLKNHDCIPHRTISPDWVWRFTDKKGEATEMKVKGPLFTNNVVILRHFVASGLGIGLLPTYCLSSGFKQTDIVEILKDYAVVSRDIYAVYSSSKYLPKKIRLFLDHLKKHMKTNLNISEPPNPGG